jgi:hypothetical protein
MCGKYRRNEKQIKQNLKKDRYSSTISRALRIQYFHFLVIT